MVRREDDFDQHNMIFSRIHLLKYQLYSPKCQMHHTKNTASNTIKISPNIPNTPHQIPKENGPPIDRLQRQKRVKDDANVEPAVLKIF